MPNSTRDLTRDLDPAKERRPGHEQRQVDAEPQSPCTCPGRGSSYGRPVADVVPHRRDTGRRRFVSTADAISALTATPMSEQDAEQWWHDIREGADDPEDPWERRAGRR